LLTLRRSLGALAALLLAALAGVTWGIHGFAERPAELTTARAAVSQASGRAAQPPEPASRSPRTAAPDERRWLAVLDALDRLRAQAYERDDPALLQRVYLPGRHLAADSAQLRALVTAGDAARGVRHRLGRLDVLGAWAGHVRLRVVQSLLPSQRIQRGRVVGVIPGTPESAVLADLVATPAGWRLA
jgi:hypothetical protein